MVEIYRDNSEVSPRMFLKLVQDGSEVDLVLVDEDGDLVEDGLVLTISEDGVEFYDDITPDAPFLTDGDGEIVQID